MTWTGRPTYWGRPGHKKRSAEDEEIIKQIELLSNLGYAGISIPSVSDTTTSGSFDDITNFSFSFTKYADWTPISMRLGMSMFSTSASTEVEIAARINSTDYTICDGFFFNEANAHRAFAAEEKIAASVIPAGTYTVQGRWRRVAGAGTLTVGSGDDFLTLFFQEMVS